MFYRGLIFILLLPTMGFNQGVYIYQQNGLYGLKNKALVTAAVYDTLIPLAGQEFFIAKKHHTSNRLNAMGVISNKGKLAIPFFYVDIQPDNGMLIVKRWQGNLVNYGVLSYSNKMVIPLRFANIYSLHNKWVAINFTNKLTLYNLNGEPLSTFEADSIAPTGRQEFYKIFANNKQGLVTATGKIEKEPIYKNISYTNKAWVCTGFSRWHIISSTDTLSLAADTVLFWNKKSHIEKITNDYYVVQNDQSRSQPFDDISPVCSSLALTTKFGNVGAVAKSGHQRLSNRFGKIVFNEGYFYTYKNNAWSVYDSLGKKRSVFTYDSVGTFNNGLFPVKRKGKWGFMNRNGKEVIHCIYDYAASFYKGMAIISYFGAQGIINKDGDWLVRPGYSNITGYSYNFFVYAKNNLYYLKDFNDKLIYFSKNPLVFKDETIFEIGTNSKEQISAFGTKLSNFAHLPNTSSNWKIINIGTKFGFEDTQGILKITYRYDSVKHFTERRAAIKLRNKWGFIDTLEQIVVQPIYTLVYPYHEGVSRVVLNKKMGLIDKNGTYILKPKFINIEPLPNNLWLVNMNGLKGIFNSKGHIIIQPNYNAITYVSKDLIIIQKNGKYGIVNAAGKSILPRMYDFIGYDDKLKTLVTEVKAPN